MKKNKQWRVLSKKPTSLDFDPPQKRNNYRIYKK
jgi:hypothetical protein